MNSSFNSKFTLHVSQSQVQLISASDRLRCAVHPRVLSDAAKRYQASPLLPQIKESTCIKITECLSQSYVGAWVVTAGSGVTQLAVVPLENLQMAKKYVINLEPQERLYENTV